MRTRFAPSPTGFLHVGGLRTALYAYLLAKQSKGQFLLRIEDTDQARSQEGAVENILHMLHWAGIDPDEGVVLREGKVQQVGDKGPYIQSQRLDLYREYAQKLLESGHAYYAFDTKEDIDRMRSEEQQAGNPAPKYDASVRMRMKNALTMEDAVVQQRLAENDPYVIRFKVSEGETITFDDDVRGTVSFNARELDDQVLLKSDGFPTYHLAHVVDDHLMEIDRVLRGEEWLSSLPKHLLLFRAFGWEPPRFAHVPLLLNADRSKLSKRQGDVSVGEYVEKGYLPEALLNFVALLGWNPGSTQELFSLKELVDVFKIERIQKGGAVFDIEKLDWLQGQWMRRFTAEEFATRIRPLVADEFPAARTDSHFEEKAALIQERISYLPEAPHMVQFFYEDPHPDPKLIANEKQKVPAELAGTIIGKLIATLGSVKDALWTVNHLKDVLIALAEKEKLTRGQVLWPLRAALTGLAFSPGAFEVAAVLGKETTIRRLEAAAKALR